MYKHWNRSLPVALACLLAMAPAMAQSYADRLRNVAERAVKSEVERKVDREVRKVTRCVLGDERCIQEAQRRGDQVEVVRVGTPTTVQSGTAGSAANPLSNVDPGGDHPLIHPYAGSTGRKRDFSAYDDYERIIGTEGGRRDPVTERLEGRVTLLYYQYPQGRSTLEVMRNYRDALVAQGMQVEFEMGPGSHARSKPRNMPGLFDSWRYMTGKLPYNGGTAYVTIGVDGSATRRTYLHVVETAGMDTGLVGSGGQSQAPAPVAAPVTVTDAGAMASGLERDGSITLGGLYFDTARATLRTESAYTLDQVAQLMRQQPQLRLLIVGHTDSTGSMAANQTLSQQRAESVRNALVGRGIAPARLTPAGAGSSTPVADNGSESGRALNRRVELVRM